MKTLHVFLNGELVPESEARISPFDRGLLLGDAVFETLRAYSGRPFDLDRHLDRLRRSASLTGIAMPATDVASAVEDVLRANGFGDLDAAVRITLTSGVGGAGASRRGAGPPTLLVTARPVHYDEALYREGVDLVVAGGTRRAPPSVLDPRVKSANYLPHVLARREAESRGAHDALLLDVRGEVCEATTANAFLAVDGEVVTPHLASGCLDGLVRARVLDLARDAGYAVAERKVDVHELAVADEIFLTGSVAEILPARTLDGRPVGRVTPGPVARAMRRAYRALAGAKE